MEDINPGSDGSQPRIFAEFQGKLYFAAQAVGSMWQMMVFDPAINQVSVASEFGDVAPLGSMLEFQGKLYFAHYNGDVIATLWTFDGSTVAPADFDGQGELYSPNSFHIFQDKLYFGASSQTHGDELYAFDGQSVELVADVEPGQGSSYPKNLISSDDVLYFGARSGAHGLELYRFDGNTTELVADINPDGAHGLSLNGQMLFDDGNLYFSANDGVSGVQAFKLNEATDTLTKISDFNTPNGYGLGPSGFTRFGERIYFSAPESDGDFASLDNEFYSYDPLTNTIELVADINLEGSSSPLYITATDDALLFRALEPSVGAELFRFDGTDVSLMSDIRPGAIGSNVYGIHAIDGGALFIANDGLSGLELWRYESGSDQVGEPGEGEDPEPTNLPPEFENAIDYTVQLPYDFEYQCVASDPEEDELVFTLDDDSIAKGIEIDPATGVVSWTPEAEQVGDHDVTIGVSDGVNQSEMSFKLTIVPSESGNDGESVDVQLPGGTPASSAGGGCSLGGKSSGVAALALLLLIGLFFRRRVEVHLD